MWVSSVSLDGCPASLQLRLDGCPASLALSAAEAPPNASTERYGDGWRCNPGYREREGACLAIELQENAHATGSAYGDGWVCKRGYAKKTGRCDSINVPGNAFLLGAASVWKCKRGYRRDGEMCSEITVPENGYPTGLTYGAGWKCLRGFKPDGDRCVEIWSPRAAISPTQASRRRAGSVRAGSGTREMPANTDGEANQTAWQLSAATARVQDPAPS